MTHTTSKKDWESMALASRNVVPDPGRYSENSPNSPYLSSERSVHAGHRTLIATPSTGKIDSATL